MGRHFGTRILWTVCGLLALLAGGSALAANDEIARGEYLVTIGICRSCHMPNLAGGHRTGGILSANITPDQDTGIGNWTQQQIVEAIRNGRRPDASPVRPPMGIYFYRDLSDKDANAIAAFLRQVPPVHTDFERSPINSSVNYGPPVTRVPETSPTDKVAYGRYLAVTVAHCMQCHSPRVNGQPDLTRMGAGGNGYVGRDGKTALSANITPANQSGIVSWTDDQLKAAITTGIRPDGSRLAPVMDLSIIAR